MHTVSALSEVSDNDDAAMKKPSSSNSEQGVYRRHSLAYPLHPSATHADRPAARASNRRPAPPPIESIPCRWQTRVVVYSRAVEYVMTPTAAMFACRACRCPFKVLPTRLASDCIPTRLASDWSTLCENIPARLVLQDSDSGAWYNLCPLELKGDSAFVFRGDDHTESILSEEDPYHHTVTIIYTIWGDECILAVIILAQEDP
eukprot:492010-Pyramimonas_sp.AAC.1